LLSSLERQIREELDAGDAVIVPVGEAPRAVTEGAEDLVGTRDEESAEITGTLAYDSWLVDREALARAAAERLARDRQAVPDGHALLADATTVVVTDATGDDRGVRLDVAVTGRAMAVVDEETVVQRIRGLGSEEAESRLADLGDAAISLWPGWVTSVPELEWRIDVAVDEVADAEASPRESP
jgi:hypothetical protein